VVEVTFLGKQQIVAACTTHVSDGMRVSTQTPRVVSIRKTLIGLLAARCPEVPIIQQLVCEYGATTIPAPKKNERCILCGLCIRACRDIVGAEALCFAGKGQSRTAGVAFLRDSQECIGCGTCVLICPTGAAQLHDEVRGNATVRVMDTWHTELAVQHCQSDKVPIAPQRLRTFVAARRKIDDDFLQRCPTCRVASAGKPNR